MADDTIRLRPPRAEEFDALLELHRLAMGDYIVQTWGPWDDALQHQFFRDRWGGGLLQAVEVDGQVVGLWEVRDEPDRLEVVNVEIHPDYQGLGLGTALIQGLFARANGWPVELQVLKINPAKRLYERLGFVQFDDTATHYRMRRETK